ncbi:MAG: glutamate-5-semialdehyde dehydrogenase [Chloroflexi bacterium]|nr:glutamate-5-semialdehyde dehydrogenase [Chloroflexota bacterium]
MTIATPTEAAAKAQAARVASRALGFASTAAKDAALTGIASALLAEQGALLQLNAAEVERARERGLEPSFVDRMTLTPARIAAMAQTARDVAALPDPVGQMEDVRARPNGMQVGRMRVPLGVIGAIYESRPNVTVDIAALCLKSGNAVVLRSGTDAHASSQALARIVTREVEAAGLPLGCVQFIDSTDRAEVSALLAAREQIDLLVPRGGAELIRRVRDEATMPVVAGGMGVCHTYIDADADLDLGIAIAVNAKVRHPSVCNTLDTVLVHRAVADATLPRLSRELAAHGVTLHADDEARRLASVEGGATVVPVEAADYDREWLSLDCSVRVVDSLDEALAHIAEHGSGHSEAIATDSYTAAQRFQREVDASSVFVNVSTGFADGGEYGLGTEFGISTQKLHARGPMGLRELTSYKWVILGSGQTRP